MKICNTPGCRKLYDHVGACEIRLAAARPYTPTTEVVRWQYEINGNPEAFDRWLAEVERAAAEKAWDDAIEALEQYSAQSASNFIMGFNAGPKPTRPVNPHRREETE